MASQPRGQTFLRIALVFLAGLFAGCATSQKIAAPQAASLADAAEPINGIPRPERYAALLEQARRGQLRELHGEAPLATARSFAPSRGPLGGVAAETFQGSYRASAKTSFASGAARAYKNLNAVLAPLPDDRQMAQQFPALKKKANNTAPRIALENRNVKVDAWIYWVAPESDRDFHVILGNTPTLTTATMFVNAEISGLPPTNPSQKPFAQMRANIRAILDAHDDANGLFVRPVPVTVTGSLLWDGEHPAPNTVGPQGLRPAKAWEIHPIRRITERP